MPEKKRKKKDGKALKITRRDDIKITNPFEIGSKPGYNIRHAVITHCALLFK